MMGTVDDVDIRHAPPGLLGLSGKTPHPGGQCLRLSHWELGVGADGIPTVTQLGGTPDGGAAFATDPDGRMGLLHRLGQEGYVGKTAIFALEGRIVAGPQFLESPDVLIGDRSPLLERRQPQSLKLLLHPTHAYSHDDPALGEDVQRRQCLGRHHRVAVRDNHDAGTQANRLGLTGQEGQHRQLLHGLAGDRPRKLSALGIWIG